MDTAQQQMLFSKAYVAAVAAVAGYRTYEPQPDDDSIDLGIAARGPFGTKRSPRVELQLKSLLVDDEESPAPVKLLRPRFTATKLDTSTSEDTPEDAWSYPLKAKNYEDLRHEDYQVPRILVVVRLPKQLDQWLKHTEGELALRRCGYWVSLRGKKESDNATKVTVKLPKTQIFSVEQLAAMMDRIGRSEWP